MSSGSYLLVDGHSIIFAWPELREAHHDNAARAREMLAARLQSYQDYTGIRVVLVFDGCGKVPQPQTPAAAIQILYSDGRKTADDLIERLCARHAPTRDLTVATADSMERQTVISFGASCIDPAGLLERLERAERDLEREIRRLQQRNR